MKSKIAIIGGILASFSLAGSALADAKSYQAAVESCLSKHANTSQAASVTLECTAGGGKLSDCKVLENSGSKGFAEAAVCVAAFLPIGDKTGSVRLPVRFPGEG